MDYWFDGDHLLDYSLPLIGVSYFSFTNFYFFPLIIALAIALAEFHPTLLGIREP